MKKYLFITIAFLISIASFSQTITVEASPNAGYFQIDGIDYPKGHFGIRYSAKFGNSIYVEEERRFSLYNIYSNEELISVRYYDYVDGVTSWAGLSQLFNSVGAVTETGSPSYTEPYELQVSKRKIEGSEPLDKFGLNPVITTATDPEDIWEGGGIYPFSTSADIISVSSSDVDDDQELIVQGLDANGLEIFDTVTLNGQTRVALNTPLLRVYRMENNGSTDFEGTVYCYSGTTNSGGVPSGGSVEKARIDNGNNQTLMAIYTVPANKVGFLYRGEAGIEWEGGAFTGTEFARLYYQSRRQGKVFKIKKAISLVSAGSSNYLDNRSFPDIIPGLTDIKLSVAEVSATMGVWGTFDIEIVDEDKFSVEFLQSIGQPGY